MQSKHNLPFACANKIPQGRDWAVALLILELAGLTFRLVAPATSAMNLYLLFRMIKLVFEIMLQS
jgi:hypothetical protein